MSPFVERLVELLSPYFPHHKETEHFLIWEGDPEYLSFGYKHPQIEELFKNPDKLFEEMLTPVEEINDFDGSVQKVRYDRVVKAVLTMRYSKKYGQLELYRFEQTWKWTGSKRQFYSKQEEKIIFREPHITIPIPFRRYLTLRLRTHFLRMLEQMKISRDTGKAVLMHWLQNMSKLPREVLHKITIEDKVSCFYTNEAFRKAKTFEELADYTAGCRIPQKLRVIFSTKLSEFAKLYSRIPAAQRPKFNQFIYKQKPEELAQVIERFDLMGSIINLYYGGGLISANNGMRIDITSIYQDLIVRGKYPLNLNWGVKRIRQEHDKWSREITLKRLKKAPKLKVSKHFGFLKSTDQIQVELISTNERLVQEGSEMRHCVVSYHTAIRSGRCAIYSVVFDGIRYTLELKQRSGTYFIAQLRGLQNVDAPKKVRELIQEQIDLHNSKNGLPSYEAINNYAFDEVDY